MHLHQVSFLLYFLSIAASASPSFLDGLDIRSFQEPQEAFEILARDRLELDHSSLLRRALEEELYARSIPYDELFPGQVEARALVKRVLTQQQVDQTVNDLDRMTQMVKEGHKKHKESYGQNPNRAPASKSDTMADKWLDSSTAGKEQATAQNREKMEKHLKQSEELKAVGRTDEAERLKKAAEGLSTTWTQAFNTMLGTAEKRKSQNVGQGTSKGSGSPKTGGGSGPSGSGGGSNLKKGFFN